MICKQCNNNVPNDSEYCPFCGNVVEKKIVQDEVVSEIGKGYTYLELKDWKKAKDIFDFAIVNNDNKAKAYIGRLLAKLKLSDLKELSSVNKKLTKFDDFKMAIKYADDNYKQHLKKYYSLVEEKISQKKVKAKKRAIISSISGVSLIVLLVLTYFVFIPLGRFSYYQNLLSNGKIEKATKSYSDSKWFEYDDKVKELFYNKGVSLVENKDYKNAEFCFETTKVFKETIKYFYYCKAQNLLEEKDLDSYNYFKVCGNFLDSEKILKTNKYYKLVDQLQGEWYYPGEDEKQILLKKEKWRKSGEYYEVDGVFYLRKNYDSYQQFLKELKEKKSVNIALDITTNKLEFTIKEPEKIIISGTDKLQIFRNSIIYDDYVSEIEFIDDKTIIIGDKEFIKQ